MGIDSIEAGYASGVDSVVITDGFGDFTLSDLNDLGLSFDKEDLEVTVNFNDLDSLGSLGLSDDVQSSLMLGVGEAAETLKEMGIDFINGPEGLIELDFI
jgi:hypothetical protein